MLKILIAEPVTRGTLGSEGDGLWNGAALPSRERFLNQPSLWMSWVPCCPLASGSRGLSPWGDGCLHSFPPTQSCPQAGAHFCVSSLDKKDLGSLMFLSSKPKSHPLQLLHTRCLYWLPHWSHPFPPSSIPSLPLATLLQWPLKLYPPSITPLDNPYYAHHQYYHLCVFLKTVPHCT